MYLLIGVPTNINALLRLLSSIQQMFARYDRVLVMRCANNLDRLVANRYTGIQVYRPLYRMITVQK